MLSVRLHKRISLYVYKMFLYLLAVFCFLEIAKLSKRGICLSYQFKIVLFDVFETFAVN